MKRKKIALLCAQLDESFQSKFVKGFLRRAFELNSDVFIFSMYFKVQETEIRSLGEANIFELANFEQYDAVVLMSDSILVPGVANELEQKISKEYKGPVLLIDKNSSIFESIKLDDYSAQYKLIEHLIVDHNYKDIAYVTGKAWHFHSKQRLRAYLDCMNDHGLPIRNERIFNGNFWVSGGEGAVDRLLSNPEDLPEAIACTNDYTALGAIQALERNGYRVPEDIAVIGYDSVEAAETYSVPVTSAPIPAEEFGEYSAKKIVSRIEGTECEEFNPDINIFYGSSCGCNGKAAYEKANELLRAQDKERRTDGFYNSLNNILENLLIQQDLSGFMDTAQTYTYQIREFQSFHLCIDTTWLGSSDDMFRNLPEEGYGEKMINVLSCGPSGEGADRVDFGDIFETKDLLPELKKDREKPAAYIFTPLYFEKTCFGYAVISYGDEPKVYKKNYYLWLRNIMIGLDCFRRQAAFRESMNREEKVHITDPLTGIFNYDGLIKHSKPMIERAQMNGWQIMVFALDINEVKNINDLHGRSEGDAAILALSQMLVKCGTEGAMCCRLGNDEFIIVQIVESHSSELPYEIESGLEACLKDYNTQKDYDISISDGWKISVIDNFNELEQLINQAVGIKNRRKTESRKNSFTNELTPEQAEQANLVDKLLTEDCFDYYFQPIVSASDGSIFAYEALMRPKTTPYISPLVVIEHARKLNRIKDVELATFRNVFNRIEHEKNVIGNRKIFINSIPGISFSPDEWGKYVADLTKYSDRIVVEMTEQAEENDEALNQRKNLYKKLGIKSALDDYGTGYSNIVNLLRYEPDYVKIDRMLLSHIQENPQKQHFVKDIVNFARENDFLVLAEGVETSDELKMVIELGADLIQGFYTGKPQANIVDSISDDVRKEIIELSK